MRTSHLKMGVETAPETLRLSDILLTMVSEQWMDHYHSSLENSCFIHILLAVASEIKSVQVQSIAVCPQRKSVTVVIW